MTSHQVRSDAESHFSMKEVTHPKVRRNFWSCIAVISLLLVVTSCASPGDDNDSRSRAQDSGTTDTGDSRSGDSQADAEMPNVDTLRRDATGAILSVKGANLSADLDSNTDYKELAALRSRGDQAVYFLNFYRDAFRLSDPRLEFIADSVQQDDLGYTQVRLSQSIDSLPVRNSQIVVQFNPEEAITLVQGRYLAGPLQYSLQPTIDDKQAEQTVILEVGQRTVLEYSGIAVLLQSTGGSNLVHEFFVMKSATDKVIVSVDAHSNRIINRTPVVVAK